MIRRALFLFLLLTSSAVAQTRAPGATSFAMGAYCSVETVGEEIAEGTITGTLNLVEGPPPFYSNSPVVPAQIGIGFGVHIDVAPELQGWVQVTTTHPPMGPKGFVVQTWQTEFKSDATSYNGFSFEYPYELVPGLWTISAKSGDRLIYHAEFTIVDPLLAPPPPCGNAPLS